MAELKSQLEGFGEVLKGKQPTMTDTKTPALIARLRERARDGCAALRHR